MSVRDQMKQAIEEERRRLSLYRMTFGIRWTARVCRRRIADSLRERACGTERRIQDDI